ncbi:copper chaperone PCu(A)C [Amycolatopsis suaedae]|uniref:Copper chaperone PCu(A)C n=1 Tax=Amycolatopsis suaedae TaxID=2510978 RepID=A0A4Q7J9U4_9PSEU|nr:copper chaperone PCu(A)C [Amycolatopsis suaedae]RZQ64560.1 copper chaperone PCu(A)C [Amycolatopsis suaedae]
MVEHGQGADTLGTNTEVGAVKLRNVYVERPPAGAYRPGEDARVAISLFATGRTDDRLTGVTSTDARAVRMRWDRACDGAAEPVLSIPLRGGEVPSPSGTPVTGHLPYYLTISDFNREVPAGTTVPLTFTFAHAGEVTLQAKVQPRDDSDEPADYACLTDPIRGPVVDR